MKEKRCPNGTRKNRKTGLCVQIENKNQITNVSKIVESVPILPPAVLPNLTSLLQTIPVDVSNTIENKKRCPNGTRKNRKTKVCESIKKKKQKNKKNCNCKTF